MSTKTIKMVFIGFMLFTSLFFVLDNLLIQEAMATEEVLANITNSYWSTSNCGSVFTAHVCRDGGEPYVKFVVQFPASYEFPTGYIYYFDSFESPYEIRNFIVSLASGVIPIVGTYDTTNRKFTGIASLAGQSGSFISGLKGNNTEYSPGFYYKFHTSWSGTYYSWLYYGCMPESSSNIYINPQWFNYKPIVTLTMADNQQLTDQVGSNVLTISGTVKDQNIGNTNTVKYSIDGLPVHNNITIATITADNTEIPFTYNVAIDTSIPPGTHTLRVWAEDSYTSSIQDTRTFLVEKTVGLNGEPHIKIVTSEGNSFNFDNETGNYSNVTNTFMVNNIGIDKPFYFKEWIHRLGGSDNTFFGYCSTSAYIGNNQMRLVTSEGKAFDVNINNGSYTEVTDSFINNNFGPEKPFYLKEDTKYINGYGPFTFYDFGSTMAYIGNNIIRVVTSEGKAFDVDKDTGVYTDVTNTFLVNNFGTGKPFYLREYTHTIGGEAKTFYDWGSSMAYIGKNTLRVVTSEGKAFDVNVNDGSYTEITSTFIVNNFGSGKPFYHRQYPVTINGTNYTFHDWSCTMAYITQENPAITINTPQNTAAFDTITLSGTVTDTGNNNVTVSASIAGVPKSTIITNTSTAQEWTLTWDIETDNISGGSYSNIVVSANNGAGDIQTVTYRGNINVYGAGSNITRDTVHYEYDSNGKLVRRYIINNP